LLTTTEADAALRATVLRKHEAPLGPTCILQLKGHKSVVTLSVQLVHLSRVLAQIRHRSPKLQVARHPAFCGTLGGAILVVELGGNRVFEATAPCAAAVALAAKAVPRVK
jgi:hypothetical protein